MIVLALLFAAIAQQPDAARPRPLPHGDLPALRHLADRLFDAVQVDVRERRRHQQHAEALHIIAAPIPWLTDPFWAKVLIILAITWRWTGYNMIFYLAALQNIDRSIYEAARIDGDHAWGRFFYITIPMLKPVILFTTVISTIGTLQLFDEVINITEGGPSDATLTLSLYIYNLTFKFMPSFGYSATVSYVIVVLVALLAFLQFYAAREKRPMSGDRIRTVAVQIADLWLHRHHVVHVDLSLSSGW